MIAVGVTMVGILNHEEIRLRQQEIEVKALAALIAHGNHYYSKQAERRLYEIAMPDIAFDDGFETLEAFEKRSKQ